MQVASAFPLAQHYRAVLAWGSWTVTPYESGNQGSGIFKIYKKDSV
jgi:hypothetical protein